MVPLLLAIEAIEPESAQSHEDAGIDSVLLQVFAHGHIPIPTGADGRGGASGRDRTVLDKVGGFIGLLEELGCGIALGITTGCFT